MEKQLANSTPAKVDEPFSMRTEEKRQEARGKKKNQAKPKDRRGRLTTAEVELEDAILKWCGPFLV